MCACLHTRIAARTYVGVEEAMGRHVQSCDEALDLKEDFFPAGADIVAHGLLLGQRERSHRDEPEVCGQEQRENSCFKKKEKRFSSLAGEETACLVI